MNPIEVDEQALAAEADRILSDLPPPAAANDQAPAIAGEGLDAEPTLEQIQAAAAGYETGAFLIVSKAADVLAPAWGITSDERKALSGSIAFAMAAWFPDHQLPPKYMALLAVAGSLYAIADSRRDPSTGKLKPRRINVPEKTDGTSAPAGANLSAAAA